MKKKILSIILVFAMVMALFVSPVMAWSALNTKCYTITTGNTTVYNSNSTSSGKKGTIFGSDEIKILGSYSNGFYYVEYPITGGTKKGYILKSAVLINTSASTRYASSKIKAYRRNSTNNTYGSIYKNDEVLVFGTRGSFTQVRYPVSSGYKFAWIKTSDANNYLKKTMPAGSSNSKGNYSGTPEKGTFKGGSFYVFSQKDKEWGSYPYLKGTIGGKYQNTNIYHSGCHLLSLVNGAYWLSGKFISPKWLAQYAIDKGYRTNGNIKMSKLYNDISNNYGSKYGIKYVTCIDNFSSLKTYLEKGYVGLGGGNGHVMAFVAYSGNKFLVLDSYYTYNGHRYVWKTQKEMTGRFNCSYFYIFKKR